MNINISLSRKVLKKIIKYLILFILGCVFIFYSNTLNVKAINMKGWGENVDSALSVAAYDCMSLDCASKTELTLNAFYDTDFADNRILHSYAYTSGTVLLQNNGMLWTYQLSEPLQPNQYYAITTYFCHESTATYNLLGLSASYNGSKTFYQHGNAAVHNITNMPIYDGTASKTCKAITYVGYVPEGNSWLGVQLRSSYSTNVSEEFHGYQITHLGAVNAVTTDDLDTALKNSNLASASSVEEVQESVNQVQEELDNVNSSIQDQIEQDKQQHDETMDTITGTDTSGADNEASGFFNDFESNDFGLSDIITLPLTTIQSITSKSCTPLSLTLPFVNKTFQLPCMTTIYSKFEPFYSIYQTITFGVISYWVCVQIYAMVKGFKDPTKDEIEVMDL